MTRDLTQVSRVILGNPENRRVTLFQQALARLGCRAATVVSYEDLLTGKNALESLFRGDVLRIESPGENFEVEKRLIARGAGHPDLEGSPQIDSRQALALEHDHGRIRWVRQGYLGLCRLLSEIDHAHRSHPHVRLHNTPADIAVMFDKPTCQQQLRRSGSPTPEHLVGVSGYTELLDRVHQQQWRRAFVKIANGSSSSGVIALDLSGRIPRAITSMEIDPAGGSVAFYNNLRVRTYSDPAEVRMLIDYVCSETAIVEQWLPKASQNGRSFDLRILVVQGRARQIVVRTSRSPMTNLHLGNQRGDLNALQQTIGDKRWGDILATAEQAAAQFANSLYVGVDLLVSPGYRQPTVLELNAFGDLLPNVFFQGEDAYATEILSESAG